MAALCQYC